MMKEVITGQLLMLNVRCWKSAGEKVLLTENVTKACLIFQKGLKR